MDFYIGFNAGAVRVVGWLSISLFALTLLLLVFTLFLRARTLSRERRRQRVRDVWQPILVDTIEVPTGDVPTLTRRDLPHFLLLWNHLHESVLDKSKDHLNQVASALCLGEAALRILRRGNLSERLLAIIALGHLRERAAWDELLQITKSGEGLLSVFAARSLMLIDAPLAVPQLIPLLLTRADWSVSRSSSLLNLAGPDLVSDAIVMGVTELTLADNLDEPQGAEPVPRVNRSKRLINYFLFTHRRSAVPAVRTIVEKSHDPEVLAACLQLVRTSLGLQFARECASHADWRVRVQAASALARIGTADDEGVLISLLSDAQWWVRYRAAQALAGLPSVDVPRLKSIQAAQSDRFARDMLTQVMAEVQLQ